MFSHSSEHSRRVVTYYYDADFASYSYGKEHVMRPARVQMTNDLIRAYNLDQAMICSNPKRASINELAAFHSKDYVKFLKYAEREPANEYEQNLKKFHFTEEDNPHFDGLYEFCKISTGGSLAGAHKLNKKKTDIAINWMGGLHHAKKDHAHGFCYTNDIVLGIMELLKCHQRVLYVDIDAHHGDGVEEAFYDSDRVMTVSFHQHGEGFFPATGALKDIGEGKGRNYSLNVPLLKGITDRWYLSIFRPVISKVMERYRPDAIVLQCGADSLSGDKLGKFNMTLRGHGECVSILRSYNLPLLLLGGGGYTPYNVARCWTYETAIAVGKDIDDVIPHSAYYEHFSPTNRLHFERSDDIDDLNSREYLKRLEETVLGRLANLTFAPSVQMQPIDDDIIVIDDDDDVIVLEDDDTPSPSDASSADRRLHNQSMDVIIMDAGEYYDGEREGDGARNNENNKHQSGRD